MPLNQQHIVELLKDILSNHQTDCCGSRSELEQIQRLITSLKSDQNMNRELLDEIQSYTNTGISTNQLNQHIEAHQEELSQWVQDINQYS